MQCPTCGKNTPGTLSRCTRCNTPIAQRPASQAEPPAPASWPPGPDPLQAADVAEAPAVLVLLEVADELGAVGAQAVEDLVDALDGEAEVADAGGVGGGARVAGRAGRRGVLGELQAAAAVWRALGPRDGNFAPVPGQPAPASAHDGAMASTPQAFLRAS